MHRPSSTESGNILFLILIAVVLFAALMFAITMSERGSGDANQDNVRVGASQLAQYGVDIESAVLRLRISKGLNESEISFETPGLTGHVNPACTEPRCRVFLPEGGQISYNPPRREWLDLALSTQSFFGDWLYTGSVCVPGMGLGHDSSCTSDPKFLELTAILPWLSKDMCIELNKRLGVPLDNEKPPKLSGPAWVAGSEEFTGIFPASGAAIIDAGNLLFGKPEGCFEGSGTPPAGSYHYYRVVLPR